MYVDGFTKDYEVAVVVSNDSDLLEPIRVVKGTGSNRGHPGPAEKTFPRAGPGGGFPEADTLRGPEGEPVPGGSQRRQRHRDEAEGVVNLHMLRERAIRRGTPEREDG